MLEGTLRVPLLAIHLTGATHSSSRLVATRHSLGESDWVWGVGLRAQESDIFTHLPNHPNRLPLGLIAQTQLLINRPLGPCRRFVGLRL